MNKKKNIEEIVSKAKNKSNKNEWFDYSKMDRKTAEKLKNKGVIDLKDYKHMIDVAGVNHVMRKHGKEEEKYKGQIPITENDFLNIPNIVENYDDVNPSNKTKMHLEAIKYTKVIENKKYTMVEEIRSGRKKLTMKTLYKKPLPSKDKSG